MNTKGTAANPYTIDDAPVDLKSCDHIIMLGVEGYVEDDHISIRGMSNSYWFYKLGVDKEKAAQRTYGYRSLGGEWPEYMHQDFRAASNLVNYLFNIINQSKNEIPREDSTKQRNQKPDAIKARFGTSQITTRIYHIEQPVKSIRIAASIGESKVKYSV